jgi:tRNA threonylcarbamoyladenosine biosynthesis protein TsaB
MRRGVAIETSGRVGSVAIVDGDQVAEERSFAHGLKNAATVIPILDELIKSRGWSPRDVEHLYVSVGPGSFTGLRIGITLAKTMALATGVKLVAVPTVRVLASNAPDDAKHLIIVLDAKRDQIFTARFGRVGGDWVEREGAHLDSLIAMLARAPRPVHLLGEGIPYHQKFIPTDDPSIIVTPPEIWRARAAAVAQIGLGLARAGQFADPLTLTPIYVRIPEAEEKYNQRQTTDP